MLKSTNVVNCQKYILIAFNNNVLIGFTRGSEPQICILLTTTFVCAAGMIADNLNKCQLELCVINVRVIETTGFIPDIFIIAPITSAFFM